MSPIEYVEQVCAEVEDEFILSLTARERYDYAVWRYGRDFVEQMLGPRPD